MENLRWSRLVHVNTAPSARPGSPKHHARFRAGCRTAIAAAAFWLLANLAGAQQATAPVLKDLVPDAQQAALGKEILDRLSRGHYNTVALNDRTSARIFDSYLRSLDPSRSYLRSADIREFEAYKTRFDDLLKAGDLGPAFRLFNRYRQRLAERLRFIIDIVENEFDALDFGKDETLERKNTSWAGSEAELKARWRRQVKNDVLSRLLAGTKREEVKTALRRRYGNQLVRLGQVNSADAFRIYTNAFLRAIDPHSSYFPPHQSENFSIHMSLSLEGIGAVLQADGEIVKVVRLVAGGPADKAGDLQPGDHIVGVGQGEQGEIVDVLGMRLRDVVSLIRGPRGTTVRLEIVPQVSTTEQRKVIRIVRNKVDLDEQQASHSVREVDLEGRTEKIGIIHIPAFYLDFRALRRGDPNYKSTAGDVKRLIGELSEAGVSGLVIDLRDNGGGALREAIALVSLFIKRGPVVQVRDGRGVIRVHSDTDAAVAYTGPLAVLVNRLSASASEIFAAAIQDYGRGLVVGGQTFGKGTVQTLIPIRDGRLKLTQAKFYRVSGDSTQNRGVIPDIELPGIVDKTQVGESSLENALAWDSIDKARYFPAGKPAPHLDALAQRHGTRARTDPDLAHLVARIDRLKKERAETVISLKEETRRARKQGNERRELESENRRRMAKGQKPFASYAELAAHNEKKTSPGASRDDDPILDEAAHILADYITLTRLPADASVPPAETPKSP